MKTKSFDDLIKTKLSQEQLDEIKKQAQLEVAILRSIQKILADTMAEYMKKNKVGFNGVVRRLSTSPSSES